MINIKKSFFNYIAFNLKTTYKKNRDKAMLIAESGFPSQFLI